MESINQLNQSMESLINDDDDNLSIKSSNSFEPDFCDLTNDAKKSNRRNYMKDYMREYRMKQREKEEEKRHCIVIRNQLCDHKEVEALLLKALEELIDVINANISLVNQERIDRLNDRSNNIMKYGELIIQTVQELINNNEN